MDTVTPNQAWTALQDDAQSRLIDVRTEAEWQQVGVPEAPDGRPVVLASWQFPTGALNPGFLAELRAAGVSPGEPLYFICRSGVRSLAAAQAAEAAGFGAAYNVAYGFEGPQGTRTGWKADGLPWRR